MNRTIIAVTAMGLALIGAAASAKPAKFEYGHGPTGDLGETLKETCNRFNAAQSECSKI